MLAGSRSGGAIPSSPHKLLLIAATAVAIGPDRADRVDAITGQLPLL